MPSTRQWKTVVWASLSLRLVSLTVAVVRVWVKLMGFEGTVLCLETGQ